MRGHGRGRSRADRSRVRQVVQDSPPTAYMYTPSGAKDAGIGRSRKASTVARNKAARCQANQHSTENYRAISRNIMTAAAIIGFFHESGNALTAERTKGSERYSRKSAFPSLRGSCPRIVHERISSAEKTHDAA